MSALLNDEPALAWHAWVIARFPLDPAGDPLSHLPFRGFIDALLHPRQYPHFSGPILAAIRTTGLLQPGSISKVKSSWRVISWRFDAENKWNS